MGYRRVVEVGRYEKTRAYTHSLSGEDIALFLKCPLRQNVSLLKHGKLGIPTKGCLDFQAEIASLENACGCI